MKIVLDTLKCSRKPYLPVYKSKEDLVLDKDKKNYVKIATKSDTHIQIPVKFDKNTDTINSIMMSSRPGKYMPVSVLVNSYLRQIGHSNVVNNQFFNIQKISSSFFKKTVGVEQVKNPKVTCVYYQANIRSILLMCLNNKEIIIIHKDDISLDGNILVSRSERLDFLNNDLKQKVDKKIISNKGSIIEIGDTPYIYDKVSISKIVDEKALSIHLDQIKDSSDSSVIINSLLKVGLITEDIHNYMLTQYELNQSLDLPKESFSKDSFCLENKSNNINQFNNLDKSNDTDF